MGWYGLAKDTQHGSASILINPFHSCPYVLLVDCCVCSRFPLPNLYAYALIAAIMQQITFWMERGGGA
jgi:hypothetical protein